MQANTIASLYIYIYICICIFICIFIHCTRDACVVIWPGPVRPIRPIRPIKASHGQSGPIKANRGPIRTNQDQSGPITANQGPLRANWGLIRANQGRSGSNQQGHPGPISSNQERKKKTRSTRATQALRTTCFGTPEAPRPYAWYASERRLNLVDLDWP